MFRAIGLIIALILPLSPCLAQHEGHGQVPSPAPMEAAPSEAPPAERPPARFLLPHSRHASGTSWLPDSTPMYGLMQHRGDWRFMLHGAAHLGLDVMHGPRGDEKTIAPNWGMLVASRDEWRYSLMLSLDPLTIGGAGYPLLFQTGETWHGRPLVDHQHPHNFFSELSAKYTHSLGEDAAYFLYGGPVGEPPLGPPTFMHRPLALDNPFSPLGHHWLDATHITFGVLAAGYQTKQWQLEAGVFSGREPGENRWTIGPLDINSYGGRLSYNPGPNWALQVSRGFLESPEALHPEEDVTRTTASAIYNRPLGSARNLQLTAIWGRNDFRQADLGLDSYILEAHLKQDGAWTPYLRHEWIEKDAEELVLEGLFPEHQVFDLQQTTLGVVRDLPSRGNYQWGLGAQVFLTSVPEELKPVYGDNPTGWFLFLRVHPRRMEMAEH